MDLSRINTILDSEDFRVTSNIEYIEEYLRCLVGRPLQYGIKRSDFDLFQLGFGECVAVEKWQGQVLEINKFAVHFDSAIYLYWENGNIDRFFSSTKEASFNAVISSLIGRRVRRIALSEKNDLWIDLGKCRMVIVTRDDEEESWRYFQPRTECPHLIASGSSLILST